MKSPRAAHSTKFRNFVIFLASGERRTVGAPTLRTTLRNCKQDERQSPIVAVVEEGCLPVKPAKDRPFCAVFLSNPTFTPTGRRRVKRPFFILHFGGVAEAFADSAADAERGAFVPRGFKNVLAVIDADLIASARRPLGAQSVPVQPRDARMPFVAICGASIEEGSTR